MRDYQIYVFMTYAIHNATLLLGRNVNPKIVSEMLGHATIAMTLYTYMHVLPHMQDEATKVLEDTLSQPTAATVSDALIGDSSLLVEIMVICKTFVLCRRWDSNPHEVALTGF